MKDMKKYYIPENYDFYYKNQIKNNSQITNTVPLFKV